MYFQPVSPNDSRASLAGCVQTFVIGLLSLTLIGLFIVTQAQQAEIERRNGVLAADNAALRRQTSDLQAELETCRAPTIRPAQAQPDPALTEFAALIAATLVVLGSAGYGLFRLLNMPARNRDPIRPASRSPVPKGR